MRRVDCVEIRAQLNRILEEIDRRYEQRFEAQERATSAALSSAQLAVDKAESNTREWQRNANEWRGAMGDKDQTFVTKAEVMDRLQKIEEALGELRTVRDIALGRASQTAMFWSLGLALLGLGIALFSLLQ